ncbi:Mu transposase C-terminal domain-containing protein [Acinetobacter towneri]|uniref:Mu transposase C-terminal domain-containing protein n=1 Tax=Acinetobacter towneri TaxID=202956 RepID=UPI002578F6A8|nr:Mu transposase C-terminal domain-containing protein [Acinetobacter towneri]
MMKEQIILDRRLLQLKVGAIVQYHKNEYQISDIVSFEEVIGVHLKTFKSEILRIDELSLSELDTDQHNHHIEHSEISEDDWETAIKRYSIIQELVDKSSKAEVIKLADQEGLHYTTIYNWLSAYRKSKSILALLPNKRGWKESKSRLNDTTEEIIRQAIRDYYLTEQKPTLSSLAEMVKALCLKNNIEPPHPNTVRYRVRQINEQLVLKSRAGKKAAKDKFEPTIGHFPNANYPLAVVQIDHTPIDIIVVDETHRLPIGRPFLTLAIDVYSRMIVGFYLSLDHPSATSVGLCIVNSILPKNRILLEHDINTTWDVWGVMDTIHTDNGADFRTEFLQRSCLKYGVNWEFRPIGKANFGGHIERLIGTVNNEIHLLEGTTFSNIQMKGNYQSEKKAAITLKELEKWLIFWMTKIYHQRTHSSLNMSPIKKWEQGIWGTKDQAGTGLKPRVNDEITLALDFLPEFKRTIQRYGIELDKLQYYSEVLRKWIGCSDPDNYKVKRKFSFRRDPRDVSYIWFYEPDLKKYFKIHTSKKEIPPISIAEYEIVQKKLQEQSKDTTNQDFIYQAILESKEMIKDASSKTKKARKQHEKNLLRDKQSLKLPNSSKSPVLELLKSANPVIQDDFWNESVEPYNDIE